MLSGIGGVVMAVVQERQVDIEAHRFATTTPAPALVSYLRETLTPRLVAFIAGVTETRATRQWAQGEREIGSAEREHRLRAAAHVTRLIAETFDPGTAQAWMQGMDPMLDGRSPAWLLRHTADDAERADVLASARRFVVQ
jgi:hypothetical protein